jgi:hypothetical protein
MSTFRNLADIIKDCGGARQISESSGPLDEKNKRPLSVDAVYKWSLTGVPDRHWPLLMSLTATSPDELHSANCAVRGVEVGENAA